MDLDIATDLKHLPDAITPLLEDRYDVVYGSRLHRHSSVIGRRASRAIVSRVFNRVVRGYLGSRISDAMCGFKFLQRKWLADLREGGANSDGWFFCAEFLLVAESHGLRLLELPVTWTDDPASKVNMPKLTREYLSAMHALKPRLQSNR